MPMTLGNLIQMMHTGAEQVGRELSGMVSAVSRDSSDARGNVGQEISSPYAGVSDLESISAGLNPPNTGGVTIGDVTIKLTKSKAYPILWSGEEERGAKTSGQYENVRQQQVTQGMRALVNEVEKDLCKEFVRASRATGTPGTTPFGSASPYETSAEAMKILEDNGVPQDGDISMVVNTAAGANLRGQNLLTRVNEAGSEDLARRGILLPMTGFDIRQSAGIQTQALNGGSAGTVDGAHSAGDTKITLSSSGVVASGDVVDVGGNEEYVVEEVNGNDITIARPGLVSDLSGGESVTISNASNAYAANLAFHRSAIHLATRAPAMPEGGDMASMVTEVTDPMTGLAFQAALYRTYRQTKLEIGLAWGMQTMNPAYSVVVMG